MTVLAALNGPLPKLGVVVIALLAAGALLARDPRARASAMLGALALAPVLLLADIWHSPQLHVIHRHPLYAVVGAALAVAALGGVAVFMRRRPWILAALAVAALPFRIPIQARATGSASNLLVPLYLVVAAGVLSVAVPALRDDHDRDAPDGYQPGWAERLLALYLVLYGIQATYSSDFEKALQNMLFFYVPFALLFVLLVRMKWTRELVRRTLTILVGLSIAFAFIAFWEYATKTIILDSKLVAQNDLHTYFVVNSVFLDPNIFGRFLALVMILVAAGLLYDRSRNDQLTASAVLIVLWGGLVLTLSRSSLLALLLGLGVLAVVRYGRWRTVVSAAVAVVVIGAAAIAISPSTFGVEQGFNGVSNGRGSLLSGGIRLFGDRPLWGFGSGSFEKAYHAHNRHSGQLTASHTIPITIAAEQGLIGEIPYVAFVIVALVALLRGAHDDPARAAVGAAFLALVVHTMLYADFLEDPVTWALLGAGMALARAAPQPEPARRRSRAGAPAPQPA